jgi:hypothetical protein
VVEEMSKQDDNNGAACCGCLMVAAGILFIALMALSCAWLIIHLG